MEYEVMIATLTKNGIKFKTERTITKDSDDITGIAIDCPPILFDEAIKRLKELLPGASVHKSPNKYEVIITK